MEGKIKRRIPWLFHGTTHTHRQTRRDGRKRMEPRKKGTERWTLRWIWKLGATENKARDRPRTIDGRPKKRREKREVCAAVRAIALPGVFRWRWRRAIPSAFRPPTQKVAADRHARQFDAPLYVWGPLRSRQTRLANHRRIRRFNTFTADSNEIQGSMNQLPEPVRPFVLSSPFPPFPATIRNNNQSGNLDVSKRRCIALPSFAEPVRLNPDGIDKDRLSSRQLSSSSSDVSHQAAKRNSDPCPLHRSSLPKHHSFVFTRKSVRLEPAVIFEHPSMLQNLPIDWNSGYEKSDNFGCHWKFEIWWTIVFKKSPVRKLGGAPTPSLRSR